MPTLDCAPHVTWSVDSSCVRLVNLQRGVLATLRYPDAALWDFVVRGVGERRMVAMMRHIGAFAGEAETLLFIRSRLREWEEQGWITSRSTSSPWPTSR